MSNVGPSSSSSSQPEVADETQDWILGAGCENPVENWLCLCCKEVMCSRFVNRHMLMHHQQTAHCLTLSYSDLSVWCFCCEAYLDAQVILQLRPVHQAAYILKFGEAPPLPQL
uniref:UBP-type domain-containing protein n=1 Tax=Brassica oleracea var. oleracea TaxID=109376 RepID=A0A0D3E2W3_BRAOL